MTLPIFNSFQQACACVFVKDNEGAPTMYLIPLSAIQYFKVLKECQNITSFQNKKGKITSCWIFFGGDYHFIPIAALVIAIKHVLKVNEEHPIYDLVKRIRNCSITLPVNALQKGIQSGVQD